MAGSAVAVAPSRELSVPDRRRARPDLEQQLSTLRGQLGNGRRLRPGRSQLGLIVLIVVALWVLLGFARTLTQLNMATNRETAIGAESAQMSARLEAGRLELQLVQTDAFQGLQARSYGMGAAGERVFSLESDAPAPPVIVPLGSSLSDVQPQRPLDAWLRLLVGD
jgi:hypothetical protein